MNPDKLHAAVESRQSRSARRECRPLGGIVEVPESQTDARADGLRVEPRAQLAKWARLLLCYETGSILERREERRGGGREVEEDVPCSLAGGELLLTPSRAGGATSLDSNQTESANNRQQTSAETHLIRRLGYAGVCVWSNTSEILKSGKGLSGQLIGQQMSDLMNLPPALRFFVSLEHN